MRLNREKCAAILAGAILALALSNMVMGVVAPSREVRVPDSALPPSHRELIPRRYRNFGVGEGALRNPFSLSEGWRGLEVTPLTAPPLPPAPRPAPSLGMGVAGEAAGFLYEAEGPPKAPEKASGTAPDKAAGKAEDKGGAKP